MESSRSVCCTETGTITPSYPLIIHPTPAIDFVLGASKSWLGGCPGAVCLSNWCSKQRPTNPDEVPLYLRRGSVGKANLLAQVGSVCWRILKVHLHFRATSTLIRTAVEGRSVTTTQCVVRAPLEGFAHPRRQIAPSRIRCREFHHGSTNIKHTIPLLSPRRPKCTFR